MSDDANTPMPDAAHRARVTNLLHTAIRYHQAGNLHRAEEVYREILRLEPEQPDALQFLGLVYQNTNLEIATQLVQRSLEINPASPSAHFNLGLLRSKAGDGAAARASYEAALARKPDYFEALFNLGVLLNEAREHAAAADQLGRALRLRPGDAAALNAMGVAREGQGDLDGAVEAYELAISARPGLAGAHANLAGALDKRQLIDAARESCARALALDPENARIAVLASRLDLRAGDSSAALARLDQARIERFPPEDAAAALYVRGHALERAGDYDDAFAAYRESNAAARSSARGERLLAAGGALPEIELLDRWFEPARVAAWPRRAVDDGIEHPAFLVGFPRSGTTLLNQILFSHSRCAVLEERDAFKSISDGYLTGRKALEAVDALDASAVSEARRRYLDHAQRYTGTLDGRLLVDKFPLHIARLPLVHRFFPGTKVVIALRDPRDVCLSCFAQNFVLNKAMVMFLDLEDTARYYEAVMRLWLRYRDALPLDVHVVRYEELVSDFDGVVRGLLGHLGLEWEERVTRFYESAGQRAIDTPSYDQVSRPISTSAVGRWRHFRRHLEPVLDRLAPLAEALGYDNGRDAATR
jgi:tetratricopeptide (TPR) repeat protein